MKVPGPTVEQIVRGVKPIYGEPFRYHVKSRSSEIEHLVDLTENGFYGQCTCEAFEFKFAPALKRGIPLDNSLMCYHIKKARKHFTETMLRRIWIEMNRQQTQPIAAPSAPAVVSNVRPQPKTYYLKPHGR